ncbi:MAG TPA: phosphatidylcholine/phosphatidylserine synthase [Planctomycetaceae bacterium]|nr:phosphatidylcholine/phosphatidylserine synthase [Planctomycetaceae bacterium]
MGKLVALQTDDADLSAPDVQHNGGRPKKRPRLIAVLPTLLTLGNAACGFGAITFAAKLGPTSLGEGPLFLNELFISALLIYLAMIIDGIDGSAARWANQTSDFGAQLDSLCDAISFGVAPAYLMLQMMAHTFGESVLPGLNRLYHPRLLWVIAVLYVMCAILRLARFNVETEEDDSHDYFSGLPSPSAAGTVAAFPVAMAGLSELMASGEGTLGRALAEWLIPAVKLSLPLITLAVACLMVSRFRYTHVFNTLFRGKKNRQHVMQLIFVGVLIFLVHEMALAVIFCYFAFAAPIRAAWNEWVAPKLRRAG